MQCIIWVKSLIFQVLIWAIIPSLKGSTLTDARNVLRFSIIIQYLPRLFLIFPLSKQIVKATGVVTETAWAGAAYNLILYMLASHVSTKILNLKLVTVYIVPLLLDPIYIFIIIIINLCYIVISIWKDHPWHANSIIYIYLYILLFIIKSKILLIKREQIHAVIECSRKTTKESPRHKGIIPYIIKVKQSTKIK